MEQSLSIVDTTTLDEDDWSDVAFECSSLAPHWEELCVFLHLPMGTDDAIKKKYPNKETSCLNEVLKLWILQKYKTDKYGLPTWKMLLKAVGKIDENLFKQLAEEHKGKQGVKLSDQTNEGSEIDPQISVSKDTQLVQVVKEQILGDKPEEMASTADLGYESSSIVSGTESTSASGASHLTKQVTVEVKIPDGVLNHIKIKNRALTSIHKTRCPCQLRNMASLELLELGKLDYCLEYQLSQLSNASEGIRLSYSSLFKEDHSAGELSRRILIVGEAGTGKSVLCARIIEDWANGKHFQEFLIVFLLPLNNRSVASAKNLTELLQNLYELDTKTCFNLQMYLTQNQKDNILIIADGWDQLCEFESQQDSFLHSLLFGDLLPSSTFTVLVATTPTSVPQQFKGRCIASQGLSEATMKSYIEMELSESPEKLSYITEQLETNPLVRSMCSVPLNLALLCNYCQSYDGPLRLPSTMPELYCKLAWNFAQLKINDTNCRDLPNKSQQSWSHLCQLAFENCQADFAQVVTSTFLSSELETFGLLKPATIGRDGDEVMLTFLLPAFKYYLAISHLMTHKERVQLEMICSMSHVGPMFWRFYLHVHRNASCDIISEIVQNISKLYHSCKDMCLISYELKNEIVDQAMVKSIYCQSSGSPIMLHSLNAYECDAMVHMLEKMNQQCTVEINFQNCTLKAMQISKLANVLSNQSKLIQIKGLDLSDNSLNDKVIVEFFNRAVSALGSLEKLFLRSCGMEVDALSAVVNALASSSCRSLTQLDLSFNSFSLTCMECLQQHIACGNLEKLEILILKGSFTDDISMSFLKQLATTLSSQCHSLRRLDLSANKLSGYDDPSLSAVVSQLTGELGSSFDFRLDENYMSEVENNYLAIMEESIRNKGTIDHTIAHGVIVGPGRSGKNTLMQRLMGEGPPDPNKVSPSTGVLENVVKVEVKKLSTIASSNFNLKWQRIKYDEEALELIMTTARHHKRMSEIPKTVSVKYIYQKKLKLAQDEKSSLPTRSGKKSEDTKHEADKHNDPESTISDDADGNENPSTHVTIYSSDIAPVDIFKKAVKLRRMDALREHLESSWSLYLTNTGGQIEFQEHLPLLVCGPSIFFVTFPLHYDLDKPYEVQYQYPDGSVKKYLSSSTLIQEILQTLATIYTLDYVTIQVGDAEITLKPTVFFIGTHKDCLQSESEKISEIDQKLQRYVRQTSLFHQNSIQFASDFENMNESRLVFTVNNLSKDDNDFQKIRFAVQQTVEEKCHKEFTVQCPSSWLIFSLILREKHKLNRVLELKECFKIAQECGISNHDELTAALCFIHSRLGLVRYFNTEGLDSLVIVDPQVLFDKITDLIEETFVGKYAHRKEIEEFSEKGIISVAAMKRISERSNKDDQLPFIWLTKLLNHLRLAAYFIDHSEEKYFFPSALCHVSRFIQSSPHSTLSVVLIAFEAGFCPRGIAGALIKCLMTNEMKSHRNWELIPSKILRNQVSFYIEDCGDVTIKVLPTHIEIAIDSPEDSAETDCSESEIHEEAYKQIIKCMKIVSSLYKKCEYYWTFYCTLAECETHPHPAVIEWNRNNAPSRLRCKVLKRSGGLPRGYKLWNLQRKGGRLASNAEVQSRHLGKIADAMAEWEGAIADKLKLTASDVAEIKTKYPQRLKLQSREALHYWKQRNGTKATYRRLTRVFERAGYQGYADEVRRIAQLSNSETDDSSGSGEEQSQPEQLTYPLTKNLEALPQAPPVIPKATETYVIITDESLPEGERGKVYSEEEALGSKNVARTFIPTLLPRKLIDVNSDHDHPDGQHQSEVGVSVVEQSSTDLLKDQTTTAGAMVAVDNYSTADSALDDTKGSKDEDPYHNNIAPVEADHIILGSELHPGNYGPVLQGTYKQPNGKVIPVVVKTVREDAKGHGEQALAKEARIMATLNHPCIVTLFGVTTGKPLMLVEEFVPLGTLVDYLWDGYYPRPSITTLKLWAAEIASGMIYLEKKHIIHNDLAARNILVHSETSIKICDFALSQVIEPNSDHWQASQGGKWPVKWYPPESINYGTFSHASDVWSYGITLWEMFTYGEPPYGEMTGAEVMDLIENYNYRLDCPPGCPDNIYKLMLSCWSLEPVDRPTFVQLHQAFSENPGDMDISLNTSQDKHLPANSQLETAQSYGQNRYDTGFAGSAGASGGAAGGEGVAAVGGIPPPKTLCATPGCPFKGYRELENLCPGCYEEIHKIPPPPGFPLVLKNLYL